MKKGRVITPRWRKNMSESARERSSGMLCLYPRPYACVREGKIVPFRPEWMDILGCPK